MDRCLLTVCSEDLEASFTLLELDCGPGADFLCIKTGDKVEDGCGNDALVEGLSSTDSTISTKHQYA